MSTSNTGVLRRAKRGRTAKAKSSSSSLRSTDPSGAPEYDEFDFHDDADVGVLGGCHRGVNGRDDGRRGIDIHPSLSNQLNGIKTPNPIHVGQPAARKRKTKRRTQIETPQPLTVAQERQSGIDAGSFHKKQLAKERADGVYMTDNSKYEYQVPRKTDNIQQKHPNKSPRAPQARHSSFAASRQSLSPDSSTASSSRSVRSRFPSRVTNGIRGLFNRFGETLSPQKKRNHSSMSSSSASNGNDNCNEQVVDLCSDQDDNDVDDGNGVNERSYQEGDTTNTEHSQDEQSPSLTTRPTKSANKPKTPTPAHSISSSSAVNALRQWSALESSSGRTTASSKQFSTRNEMASSSTSGAASHIASQKNQGTNDDDDSDDETQVRKLKMKPTSITRFVAPSGTSDLFPETEQQEEDDDEPGRADVCTILVGISDEPFGASAEKAKPGVNKPQGSTKSCATKSTPKAASAQGNSNILWGQPPAKPQSKLNLTKAPASIGHSLGAKKKKKKGTLVVPGRSLGRRQGPEHDDPIEAFSDDSCEQRQQRSVQTNPYAYSRSHLTRTAKKKTIEATTSRMVDLEDTDEEKEDSTALAQLAPMARTQRREKTESAPRIAIGMKVFQKACELSYVRTPKLGKLTLSFDGPKDARREHTINLDDNSIWEMKYFLAGDDEAITIDLDESATFLVLRIEPNEENGLGQYPNKYVPSLTKASPKSKRYIAIEFRSDAQLQDFLKFIKDDEALGAYVSAGSRIKKSDIEEYGSSLLGEARKERKNRESRIGSPRARRTRKKRGSDRPNEIKLVFPFGADESEIDKAGEGLQEAGVRFPSASSGGIQRTANAAANLKTTGNDEEMVVVSSDVMADAGDDKEAPSEKTKSRAHFLTIRDEDYDRLQPGEFLNDTLIDFWFQWMWRKSRHSDCDVHVFTSHFYSTLLKGGPDAVTSWTAKKNIDVFQKKFVFVPINQSLHWSLCVVVNPGSIMNHHLPEEAKTADLLLPCIFFFDSLKAHRKNVVARRVCEWLNSEWRRLGKAKSNSEIAENPFTNRTMRVYDPRVPYQDNSWDCGVFVCRYGFGMFLLRDLDVTYGNLRPEGDSSPFQTFITESEEFNFDRDDIARIRRDLAVLLDRLSTLHKEWKKANDEAEKLEEDSKKPTALLSLPAARDGTVVATSGDLDKSAEMATSKTAESIGDVEMADANEEEVAPDVMKGETNGKKEVSPVKMEEDQFGTGEINENSALSQPAISIVL